MKRNQLVRFLAVTFGAGLALQLVALRLGLGGPGGALLPLVMWTPALGALTSRAARRRAKAALTKSGGRFLAFGLLAGWSLTLVQLGLLFFAGGARWNDALFVRGPHGIESVHKVALVFGVGAQSYGFFAVNVLLSIALGSLLNGLFFGLGEELGWRAVLQPELERRFGALRGSLATGLIWAYWHLPVNLAGYNDSAHPLWNSLVFFPLVVVAMAFIFGWLVRRSGSVWPAALAHGANNTLAAGFLLTATGWSWDTFGMLAAALLVGGFFAWKSRARQRRESAALPLAA